MDLLATTKYCHSTTLYECNNMEAQISHIEIIYSYRASSENYNPIKFPHQAVSGLCKVLQDSNGQLWGRKITAFWTQKGSESNDGIIWYSDGGDVNYWIWTLTGFQLLFQRSPECFFNSNIPLIIPSHLFWQWAPHFANTQKVCPWRSNRGCMN